jgi:hypothetical protein
LLQVIWDEVGEPDAARDRMLLELEQECLEVYRRKVDLANRCRAQLRQAIAEAEAELAGICSGMGEAPIHVRQVSVRVHTCLQVSPCHDRIERNNVEYCLILVLIVDMFRNNSTRTTGVQSQIWCKRTINHSHTLDLHPMVPLNKFLNKPAWWWGG